MKSEVVCSIKLTGLRPIILYGEPIYLRYEKIRKSLIFYLGDDFDDFLTMPNIPSFVLLNEGKASWLSDTISDAIPLVDLSEDEKKKSLSILNERINLILELSRKLATHEDNSIRQLGELLEYSIVIPSEDFIFVKNSNICLVAWGFAKDKSSDHSSFKITNFLADSNIELPTSKTKNNKKESLPKSNLFWYVLSLLFIISLFFLLIFNLEENFPDKIAYLDADNSVSIPHDLMKRNFVPDVLTVGLKETIKAKVFFKEIEKIKLNVEVIGSDDLFKIIQLKVKNKEEIKHVKSQIEKLDFVEFVVFDVIYESNIKYNDPALIKKEKSYWLDLIGAKNAWKKEQGNEDVLIAVLDVGFDLNHSDLKKKVVSPWNITNHSRILTNSDSKLAHGTHVSALIVAEPNNSKGIVGICPKCSFIPIQVSNNKKITTSSIMAGLSYAIKSKASVINLSLGSYFGVDLSSFSEKEKDDFLKATIRTTKQEEIFWNRIFAKTSEKGIIVSQAAGNDNLDVRFDPMKRVSSTLIVGATDRKNRKSSFSNYSKSSYIISAPGNRIYSAFPEDRYGFMDGTSMSTPIVSGAVALLLSKSPSLNIKQIKEILSETGKSLTLEDGRNIGKLIQIDKALGLISKDKNNKKTTCEEENKNLRDKLEKLEKEKNKLLRDNALKIPTSPKENFKFAEGSWSSSDNLVRSSDNTPIKLKFQFDQSGNGQLTLIEKFGVMCQADVKLSLHSRKLDITQLDAALCDNEKSKYLPYTFSCMPESGVSNIARCNAINAKQAKLLEFRLYQDK